MIPYRDEGRQAGIPLMTITIIALNVVVYMMEVSVESSSGTRALEHFVRYAAVVPYVLTHHLQLPAPAPHPEWLTLVTSQFVHGGLAHIFFNMLFLYVFGPDVEYLAGAIGFLIFYLVCGAIASGVHVLMFPDSNVATIGASGAIAGVLGAFIVFFGGNRIDAIVPIGCFPLFLRVPAIVLIGFWIVVQVLQIQTETGSTGGIGYVEHVTGFVAGMLLIFAFKIRDPQRSWAG